LQQFEAWLEPQLAPFGALGHLTDWAGKLVGAVIRLTGILHMAAHADAPAPWEIAISQDSVVRAIRLAEYLIPHARAAYAEMGADPVIAEAKHLLAWITREGKQRFTKRDAFEGTKGRFKRVEALEPGLKLLMEHGFLRPREPGQRPGPGRKPSPTYDVNPYAHNSRYAQNRLCPSYSEHSANSATKSDHIRLAQ
jgi:replicative DNA helicase